VKAENYFYLVCDSPSNCLFDRSASKPNSQDNEALIRMMINAVKIDQI